MLSNMNYSLEEFTKQVESLDGMVMEFGVATGRTITKIAQSTKKTVYGFDSFEGMPETAGVWIKGEFKCPVPSNLPENVVLTLGFYEDVLDDFLSYYPEKVSFLHMDSDLYSSTKFVLNKLKNRIQNGTIIAFDEMFPKEGIVWGKVADNEWAMFRSDSKENNENGIHWPGKDHEWKAFNEFLSETEFECVCIGKHQDKAAFVISNVK